MPESKFIYKNILRKQKLIDTINYLKKAKPSKDLDKQIFTDALYDSIVNQKSDFTHVSNFYENKKADESLDLLMATIEKAEKTESTNRDRSNSKTRDISNEVRKQMKSKLSMPTMKYSSITKSTSKDRKPSANMNKFMLTSRASEKVSTFNTTTRTPVTKKHTRLPSTSSIKPLKATITLPKTTQMFTVTTEESAKQVVRKVRVKSVDLREKVRQMSKDKPRAYALSTDRNKTKVAVNGKTIGVKRNYERVNSDLIFPRYAELELKRSKLANIIGKVDRNDDLLKRLSTEIKNTATRKLKTLVKL